MSQLNLLQDVNGTDGFCTRLRLSEKDLDLLRKMVRMQWLYRLQLLDHVNVHQFDKKGMEHYHELSHLIDHATAWPKLVRILPREAVKVIRQMDFIKTLENEIGEFTISDEEHFGWENVYWRLVRPGNSDFGSLHADKWFWDIGGYGKVADFPHTRLKMWIPIYSVAGKNGLLVSPGSHLKNDWQWHAETRGNLNKPVLDEPVEKLNLTLLPLSPGECVVFHDELIHGGAANLADTTRFSMEFTILMPEKIKSFSAIGKKETALG